MTFESLDVVVVPFPFADSWTVKRRPALIISSTGFNRVHHQSILTMITSAGSDWPSDVVIQSWREAGLIAPCKVRFKLFTLDRTLLTRKLGTLLKQDGEAVKKALGRILASDG